MRKILISLLLTVAPAVNAQTSSSAFSTCKFVADKARKSLPIQIDSLTKMVNVTCVELFDRPLLLYVAEVKLTSDYLHAIDLQSIKPVVLNTWCTDPNMRVVLEMFDVNYRYYLIDGVFIGDIKLKNTQCDGNR